MTRQEGVAERKANIVKKVRDEIDDNLADVIENWFEDGFSIDEVSAMLDAARAA